ncbi:MAG TPA: ATP-binding cassette domain-containing protein [Nitrospirae bacterium]|nr:ATP-binding cassette domain-containing protein [Nitrospirota bacterium]
MEKALIIKDLVAGYNNKIILKKISFDVPKGMITAIVGGSGSGKSTILKHLIGLLKPLSGEIITKGYDLTKLDEKDLNKYRKSMGVLFQGSALLNSLTIEENVALPIREHSKLNESTIKIMVKMKLDLVGLSGFGNFYPSQLSGGMKKRAGIARAMALDPELIFFDEPQAGLDPITASGLDFLIMKLRDLFKMTVVVVTHELHSLFTIADKIIHLDKGELIFDGTKEEFKRSENPKIVNFINRIPEEENYCPEDYFNILTAE